MLKQKQLINYAGVPIEFEFISASELGVLHFIMNGAPGSRRFHNRGIDGLFLHSATVLKRVQETKVYKTMSTPRRQLLSLMALYHDYFDKVISNSNNDCHAIKVPFWAKVIVPAFTKLVKCVVISGIHDYMYGDPCKEDIDIKPYLLQWINGHHGFNSDYINLSLNKEFLVMVMEIARCDSSEANFSDARQGASSYNVGSLDLDIEGIPLIVYEDCLNSIKGGGALV